MNHPRLSIPLTVRISRILPFQSLYDLYLLERSAENLDAHSEVEGLRINPALRTLDFFRSAKDEAENNRTEAMGLPFLDTSTALRDSPSLVTLAPLGENDLNAWLAYWRRVGYL